MQSSGGYEVGGGYLWMSPDNPNTSPGLIEGLRDSLPIALGVHGRLLLRDLPGLGVWALRCLLLCRFCWGLGMGVAGQLASVVISQETFVEHGLGFGLWGLG